jgi:hypothetical protein
MVAHIPPASVFGVTERFGFGMAQRTVSWLTMGKIPNREFVARALAIAATCHLEIPKSPMSACVVAPNLT